MQYSISTAIATILFASSFTSAAVLPRAASTVSIQLKTGDGDASVQNTIAVGSLQTKQSSGQPLSKAVNAFVVDSGFTCQAFSDAKGAQKLGSTFDSITTASFTDASDGEVDSNANSAVALGSICCAATAKFAKACATASATASPAASAAFSVRIQIDGPSELATQGEILADGKPHVLTAPLEGDDALSVSIVQTPQAVQCEAFGDAAGKQKLGQFSVGMDAVFPVAGVDIVSIACVSA